MSRFMDKKLVLDDGKVVVIKDDEIFFEIELWQEKKMIFGLRSRNIFFLIHSILKDMELNDQRRIDLVLRLAYRFFDLDYMSDLIYAQRRGSISSFVNTLNLNEEENEIYKIILDYCK